MVLVSHRYKFIYIKTIKTASTTVEDFFQRFCLPQKDEDMYISHHESRELITSGGIVGSRRGGRKDTDKWYSHMPATEVKKLLGPHTWRLYFKFTVVRNPWDKVVSMYHHRFGPTPQITFTDYVKKYITHSIDWNIYTIKKEPRCNFYIRFENLEEDIERVCKILRVPFNKNRIEHYKPGQKIHTSYRDYYNIETKEIVRKVYGAEINFFKYVF
jgi:hypothetical protein